MIARNRIRLAAGLALLFAAGGAGAQSSAPVPLTYADAVRQTLASHPQWRRFALERDAADARRELAGLKPGMELAVEAEDVLGTGAYPSSDSAPQLTVSLGSVFERAGKRRARVEVQERSLSLLRNEQRVEALDLLAETGRRFIDVAVAQERVRLAALALDQANATVALVEPRVAAARSSRMELLNAQVRQTGARVARSAAQRELVAAQVSLAALWGDTQGRPTVALELVSTPQPAGFEELESRLAAVPDLARYATESALREAEVRLARAQAVADWRWSIGVRRYERTDDQALAFGLSMPLNGTRRAAPAIRESLANRAIVEQQADAARIALRPVLFEQWQTLQTLRERVIAIGAEDLPRALEALEITERGYRIGRFPYRELALAQAQLIDLELQRLDAAAQYHLTQLEIDRLTGAEISQLPETSP